MTNINNSNRINCHRKHKVPTLKKRLDIVLCRSMCLLSSEDVFTERSITGQILNLKLNATLHLALHSNFASNFAIWKNKYTKMLQNAKTSNSIIT